MLTFYWFRSVLEKPFLRYHDIEVGSVLDVSEKINLLNTYSEKILLGKCISKDNFIWYNNLLCAIGSIKPVECLKPV